MLCELGEDKVHSSFIIAIDTESTIGPMILHKLEYKASAEDIHLHSSLNFYDSKLLTEEAMQHANKYCNRYCKGLG